MCLLFQGVVNPCYLPTIWITRVVIAKEVVDVQLCGTNKVQLEYLLYVKRLAEIYYSYLS